MANALDAIYEVTEDPQQALESGSAAVHYWREKKLEPWSFGRQTAWRRAGYNKIEDTLESACAIVYLCTLTPEEINRVRGPAIATFQLALDKWADQQGATLNSDAGQQLIDLGTKIWLETKQAQFEPVVKGDAKAPDPKESGRPS